MTFDTPVEWTEEADVVVVGYGGAGAVAAITAHDAGARVLILEKQSRDTPARTNHTPNTRMSGGNWLCPSDPEKAKLYIESMIKVSHETIDAGWSETIAVLAESLVDNSRWMRSIGADTSASEEQRSLFAGNVTGQKPQSTSDGGLLVSDFPDLPGADCSCIYTAQPLGSVTTGAAFFKVLTNAVEQRGIEVLWATAGEHLVTEGNEVKGVIARRGGKTFAIRAGRSVILTCGGFEFNDWMKQNYLRCTPAYFTGNPANTGDGINMSLEVGAALWHMNAASWRAVMKFPEFPVAFATRHHTLSSIFVDKTGRRFTTERYRLHTFGYDLTTFNNELHYPRVPFYWIFDEKRRTSGPLASEHGACLQLQGKPGSSLYSWSADNLPELERGWILKAGSIGELADIIRADTDNDNLMRPAVLKATMKRYNSLCRKGEDVDFHRPQKSLTPIEGPPFYAVKLWPGGPNTQGGPKRNKRAQVVRPDDSPVPRLYAAGELGSVWGMVYQGGGNLGECIAFGRIAGANAAAEKPW
jgi:3-oxosteroid 1-dehydrogenase